MEVRRRPFQSLALANSHAYASLALAHLRSSGYLVRMLLVSVVVSFAY
jgi:hypothetical protein